MAKIQDLKTGKWYSLPRNSTFVVGRSSSADLPLRDLSCSRKQFCITVDDDDECQLQPLSATSPTFCAEIPIHAAVVLDQDVHITAGNTRFLFSLDDEAEPERQSLASQVTALGYQGREEEIGHLEPIRIDQNLVIGRDPAQADIVLAHVRVSRKHARIIRHQDGAILTDLGSSGGTYVNGNLLRMPHRIVNHDVIGIGPYQLTFDHGFLTTQTREDNLQLVARDLTKVIPEPGGQGTLTILNKVSLVIRPHEFVCILGPAGSGKSTLLSALSARAPAHFGRVTLNQVDLYQNFDQLKHDLVVVPQRDLLHRNLTVEASLRYTARLRLPGDVKSPEIDRVVDDVLEQVGLLPQRHSRIHHLSGGQTKRASLAHELVANPSLVFLDEVTSGLDEQSDREIMQLCRRLAADGKTILCVTHNLANVESTAHLVVILAEGGNLAFVGSPTEAREYFQIERLGDVYESLRQLPSEDWRLRFLESPQFKSLVGLRLASAPVSEEPANQDGSLGLWEAAHRFLMDGLLWKQTPVLLKRYCATLWQDKAALAATAGQCLLVAILLILVFGDITDTGQKDPLLDQLYQANHSASLLFLIAVSCLWFGCNNASKEFVKERDIFRKESQVSLSALGYYLSKLLPLSVWSASQAVLLYGVVAYACHLPDAGIWGGGIVISLAIIGVTLGLLISAIARSEEFATAVIPMILIPQIILSGGIKALDGVSRWIAEVLISCYWGFGLLRGTLPEALHRHLEAAPTGMLASLSMLLLHGLLFSLAAAVILRQQCRIFRG